MTLAEIQELTTNPPRKVTYSINEAMAATGLGKTRLYTEIREGRLKAVKAGRRTLITAASIDAWVSSLLAA
jgi:excisionase family DNA binding protein